jgi:hypothetical protein
VKQNFPPRGGSRGQNEGEQAMDQPDHTPELQETTDEWHLHTAAEGVPQEEHGSTINAPLLVLAFIGTVLSVVAVVILTFLYFTTYTNQLRRTRIETTALSEDYLQYRGRWQDTAQDYRWVSVEGEGVVSLPLQVAMERVLERYQQQGGSAGEGTGR